MGINSVLGSIPMDPDSKPKGPKDKKGRELPSEHGRWEIAGSNGSLWDTSWLLDIVGDLDEKRSCSRGDFLTGYEVERSHLQHGTRKFAHEGTGLEMEVAKHDIRAPPTDKLNDTGVNFATE
jgi:hypothetical protein